MSASTNIATALAAFHNGAVPVPVDSERDDVESRSRSRRRALTPRTRAIIPVHLFGHPVDMDQILRDRRAARPCSDRGLRRVARRNGPRPADRLVRHDRLLQLLRQQDHHDGRRRDGADRRRRARRAIAATAEPRVRTSHASPRAARPQLPDDRLPGSDGSGAARERSITSWREASCRPTYTRALADVPGITTPVELPWARHVYWMYGDPRRGRVRAHPRRAVAALARARCRDAHVLLPDEPPAVPSEQPGFRDVPCPVGEELWRRGLYLPSSPSLRTT